MGKYILGIDPGLHGGLAVYDIEEKKLSVRPTPIWSRTIRPKTKTKPAKTRTEYDIPTMAFHLAFASWEVEGAIIEEVAARPGQGVTSMFRFGYGLGLWHGLLNARGIPYTTVLPQVWKKQFALLGEEKDASRAAATSLFPECADLWKLKKHDGLAEAALLVAYKSRELGFPLENIGIRRI